MAIRSFMTTRTYISMLVYGMTQAVLFFVGTLITLISTDQSDLRGIGIAASIVVSVIIAPVVAYTLAPRLRSDYVRDNVTPMAERL